MSSVNQRRIRRIAREADDRYIINRSIEAVEQERRDADVWTAEFIQKIADLRAAEEQMRKPWWRFWI